MSLYEEIHELEHQMFDSVEAAYKSIANKKRDDAKAFIAAVEILNSEYKEITKVDFVKQSVILDLYEKLWRCNGI
jgi:hypothetical protein